MKDTSIPVALTIAGSDSGGGAGIQADLRTFAALRVFGVSAVTLITAQNTKGVDAIEVLDPALVSAQIDAIVADFNVGAVKTGALGNKGVVEAVALKAAEHGIEKLVVDPVMISKHGFTLLEEDAAEALKNELFPRALIITPNAYEAKAILGMDDDSLMDPGEAAMKLTETGARYVLLKGGHLVGGDAVDYLSDGSGVVEFRSPRIDTPHTHGTGCTLSAAIAAFLARGFEIEHAVRRGKEYVEGALNGAVQIGGGISPVHHMHEYYDWGDEE